jgi:hypothetical protein
MKLKISLLLLLFSTSLIGQDLNAEVTVNSDRISASANPVFSNLEKSISNFLNQTKWTDRNLNDFQKTNCKFNFILTDVVDFTRFSGILQIQASRPVYGSLYQTTIFNFRDTEVGFTFNEFQSLNYNENSVNNNLETVLAFYVHIILGLESESFESDGGLPFFQKAEQLAGLGLQSGYAGWANEPNSFNKYALVNALLASSQQWFRVLWYDYHRMAMDMIYQDDQIYLKFDEYLEGMDQQSRSSYNNFLKRLFFDSKMDEVVSVLNLSPPESKNSASRYLGRLAPSYRNKWEVLTIN